MNQNHYHNNYNDDLWGAHMYLLKRSYAKYLIDTLTTFYIIDSKSLIYSSDLRAREII